MVDIYWLSKRLGFLEAEAKVWPHVVYTVLDLLVIPLFPITHQTSHCQKVPDVGIIGQAAHLLAVDPAWDVVHLK